jgi:hypothetical protein
VSNRQTAQELGRNEDDAQRMTEQLRTGIVASEPVPRLSGAVECDEAYVVADHRGHPEAVKMEGFWSLLRSWLSAHRGISHFPGEASSVPGFLSVRTERPPSRGGLLQPMLSALLTGAA